MYATYHGQAHLLQMDELLLEYGVPTEVDDKFVKRLEERDDVTLRKTAAVPAVELGPDNHDVEAPLAGTDQEVSDGSGTV